MRHTSTMYTHEDVRVLDDMELLSKRDIRKIDRLDLDMRVCGLDLVEEPGVVQQHPGLRAVDERQDYLGIQPMWLVVFDAIVVQDTTRKRPDERGVFTGVDVPRVFPERVPSTGHGNNHVLKGRLFGLQLLEATQRFFGENAPDVNVGPVWTVI